MKKLLSVLAIIAMLVASLFAFSGCGNKSENNDGKNGGDAKKDDTVEISVEYGKGIVKMNVPKNEDGPPKYEFTKDRPEGIPRFATGTYYIETEKAYITFASKGLTYNTSKDYKDKYGDVKASFQGYLDYMDDESSTIPKATEITEINGKKAVKRESKQGSGRDYKYFGYYYMVEADDVNPGSYVELGVFYKGEEEHTSADPIDEEAQAVINSYSMTLKN